MTFENLATRLPQLGSKRVCVSCATRFYDMTHVPPVCPKCETVQPPEVPRVRAPVREPRRPFRNTPAPVAAEPEEEAAVEDAETEDDAEVEEVDDDDDDALEIIPAPEQEV
jgi:hypothetical protein